jgi:hypothetical protein
VSEEHQCCWHWELACEIIGGARVTTGADRCCVCEEVRDDEDESV